MSELPWGGTQLTIIALLKGSNGLFYIGADSQWTDPGGFKFYESKLRFIDDGNVKLAWGTGGNPQIGIVDFSAWLNAYSWTGTETWSTFIIEIAKEFARLNRLQIEIGEQAGDSTSQEFRTTHLCQMLICGYLGKEGKGYAVVEDGGFREIDALGGRLATLGTGGPFADAVDVTQYYYKDSLSRTDEQIFRSMMELTALHADQCSLPYEIIEISPTEKMRYSKSKEPESAAEHMTPATQSETGNNEP